ncbi:MAG: GDP-mannose 4,6-dehydratase [Methanosphaera sp. rholeuAM74]|nr:MAG: GDP-mannose 4,6-dehydratase [Methanosphaera sp. rholeuAM74]
MNWKDKNVLITGIGGFVGPHLSKALLEKGANIYGLIRRHNTNKIPVNLEKHRIEDYVNLVMGDLTDIPSLANAIDYSQPDYIFHLAAQSFVPYSFEDPQSTTIINSIGTQNLLESMRIKDCDARMIFAGSSEEYGLIISSKQQYEKLLEKYGHITPDIIDNKYDELPISENNPLRPMNPYAVSKLCADFITRNYHHSFGLDTIVSRAFNHEGAGRGDMFVTSVITKQVNQLKKGLIDSIKIGNVNAFRDWTHINDMINGYINLAENGVSGEAYNQASMRTNSIISYILLSLEEAGYTINSVTTLNNDKRVDEPTLINDDKYFGVKFDKTKVDSLLLENQLEYSIKDKGLLVNSDCGVIKIEFNPERFRPSDVPILLADNTKIRKIGMTINYGIRDIIKDQLEYFN